MARAGDLRLKVCAANVRSGTGETIDDAMPGHGLSMQAPDRRLPPMMPGGDVIFAAENAAESRNPVPEASHVR